ncbi:hypothetical protein B0H11DRAFT_2214136 [Mycena galericulata]|nr:hypothetical protein B0H11DRAFT_2214136 [Mycena galericulata]
MHRHRNSIHRGSASSSKLLILGTQRPSATRPGPGRPPIEKQTLARGPKGIAEYRRAGAQALRARLQNMGPDEREALRQLQELAEDDDFDPACLTSAKARKAEEDCRTRRDRTQLRNAAFQAQMPAMVTAYTRYRAAQDSMPTRAREYTPPPQNSVDSEEVYTIQVVDMLATSKLAVTLDPRGGGIAPALIMEGLVPCAPWTPNVAIAVRVLEAYRVAHVRCPQLGIQPHVKSLCDVHGVPYRPYRSQQFSIAYGVYLAIRRQTDECIEAN